ncbi:MAG: ATP-binding protein [Dehalococcoidia bacterium]|nr:ATP-binding protein [Dehalococcoidia bacterium]
MSISLWKGAGLTFLTCIFRDISERQKMLEYQHLAKVRADVLSLVSHELRTPLAAIKGYTDLLLNYGSRLSSSEKRENLQAIDESAKRLAEMVDHLLDVSRMESGLLTLNRQPTSILDIVTAAVSNFRLVVKDRRFVVKRPPKLTRLNIDARRIRQVVENLLDNAVKYSEKGTSITVAVRRQGDEVVVSVADQGWGIPPEELPRLFDRAHAIKKRLTPGASGLGLGLNLCKGLVEAHGGRIWAESTPGKGSTFYFSLPVKGRDQQPSP